MLKCHVRTVWIENVGNELKVAFDKRYELEENRTIGDLKVNNNLQNKHVNTTITLG